MIAREVSYAKTQPRYPAAFRAEAVRPIRSGHMPVSEIAKVYEERKPTACASDDVLVISCDGKGVVMRPDVLRAATAQVAVRSTTKVATRLSKGREAQPQAHGRGRRRVRCSARSPHSRHIPPDPHDPEPHVARPAPHARNKWLIAIVEEDAAAVVSQPRRRTLGP
jgi:hypothetical protein